MLASLAGRCTGFVDGGRDLDWLSRQNCASNSPKSPQGIASLLDERWRPGCLLDEQRSVSFPLDNVRIVVRAEPAEAFFLGTSNLDLYCILPGHSMIVQLTGNVAAQPPGGPVPDGASTVTVTRRPDCGQTTVNAVEWQPFPPESPIPATNVEEQ